MEVVLCVMDSLKNLLPTYVPSPSVLQLVETFCNTHSSTSDRGSELFQVLYSVSLPPPPLSHIPLVTGPAVRKDPGFQATGRQDDYQEQ